LSFKNLISLFTRKLYKYHLLELKIVYIKKGVPMVTDDEFELMSHKDVEKLKKELSALRKSGTTRESQVVLDSMDKLNENIVGLTDVFREATMELKISDNEAFNPKLMHELSEKIDSLLEQNEKMAEAILTVAEVSNELKDRLDELLKETEEMNQPIEGVPSFGNQNSNIGQDNFNNSDSSMNFGESPPFNPSGMGSPNFGNPSSGMGSPNFGNPSGMGSPNFGSPSGMGSPNFGNPSGGMGSPNFGNPSGGMGNPNFGSPSGMGSPPPPPPETKKKPMFTFK
jgi:hypothetical protein